MLIITKTKKNKALELEKEKREERKKKMGMQKEVKKGKNIPKTYSDDLHMIKQNDLYTINRDGEDKEFIKEYETLMGDRVEDNPMGYIDWLKKKIAQIYNTYQLNPTALSNIKKKERLRSVAYEISKKFSYSKITEAIAGEGLEVHSFLQNNFDDYEELIEEYVLDTACAYAKRYYVPELIKFMYGIDINRMIITKIALEEETILPNYPELTFKEVFVLAKTPLTEALTWIPKFSHEIDGYNAKVTYGPSNIGLLDWVIWDKPLVVVLHAVGKSEGLFKAVGEAKDIQDTKALIYKRVIHQSRTSFQPLLDKMDEIVRDGLQADKKYVLLKKKIERNVPSDIMGEYKEIEKDFLRKDGTDKKKWKNIAIVLIVLVFLAIIIVFLVRLPTFMVPPSEIPSELPEIEVMYNTLKLIHIGW